MAILLIGIADLAILLGFIAFFAMIVSVLFPAPKGWWL